MGTTTVDTTTRPRAPYIGARGVSTAFATFGELLQGMLPERNSDFLVTMPIARWAAATFQCDPDSTELRVLPVHKTKALRLADMIMESAPVPVGGLLTIDSGIPEGKGLASSSADLVATARALANALGLPMSPARIESYLRRIEPTDGVLYPGVVAYYHRRVALREMLGSLPPATVVGIDEGGEVDTIAFNSIPKPFSAADRREYARLLDRMGEAIRSGDLATVGAIATRSTEMHQVLQPKNTLSSMLDICREVGGLGVLTAHSGTSLGILLDATDPAYPDKIAAAASASSAAAGNVSVYRALTFDKQP